ncbi:MAG TPA: hypothetical protein H9832_06635, partial [Candidatus Agathobaculum merdavium]|nr:hypothetical protein [Candidatus Agathobaculum merdavium]
EQISARVAYNEIDLVLFFRDPMSNSEYEPDVHYDYSAADAACIVDILSEYWFYPCRNLPELTKWRNSIVSVLQFFKAILYYFM